MQDNKEFANILILSDMHFGHITAAMPPRWRNPQTGAIVGLNVGQAYLHDCWQDMLKRVPQHLDALIVVGDAIEGRQPAAKAGGLSLTEPTNQVELAKHYLEPLVQRTPKNSTTGEHEAYIAAGTRYHVGGMAEYEETLARELNAKRNRLGGHVWDWVRLSKWGVTIDAEHTQSFHQRYRSTTLEKSIGFARERISREGGVFPEGYIVARGHAHTGLIVYRERNVLAISLPPWKMQDDYAATSTVPNRMIPYDLGAVLVHIYKERSDYGKIIEYTPILYKHPPLRAELELGKPQDFNSHLRTQVRAGTITERNKRG